MDGSFVNAIRDMVRPETFEVEGVVFDSAKRTPLPMPGAAALVTTTLASMRDYMDGNLDDLDPNDVVAHIVDPNLVQLRSKLDEKYRQRESYVHAKASGGRFEFGQFMEVEEFIIKLQGLFLEGGDRETILKVVGNLSDGVIRNIDDDGVTQTVNTKVGVTQRAEAKIPNPVILTPFRTFPDVEQPSSKFIFRMSNSSRRGEETPSCALFEADNGAWRAVALSNIKEWLRKNLPTGVTILS